MHLADRAGASWLTSSSTCCRVTRSGPSIRWCERRSPPSTLPPGCASPDSSPGPRRGGQCGIVAARREGRAFPCGLFCYRVEDDLKLGKVLIADHFVAVDLLDPASVLTALVEELDGSGEASGMPGGAQSRAWRRARGRRRPGRGGTSAGGRVAAAEETSGNAAWSRGGAAWRTTDAIVRHRVNAAGGIARRS